MDSTTTSSSAAPSAGELVRERDRVSQRLRSMAVDRIPRERVHAAAQQLADLAADSGDGPRRTVPLLAAYASGDQIAVLTDDLIRTASADAHGPAAQVLRELRHDLSAPEHP